MADNDHSNNNKLRLERFNLGRRLERDMLQEQTAERRRRSDALVAKTNAAASLADIANLFAEVDGDADLHFAGVRPRELDDRRWPTHEEIWASTANNPPPATLADVLRQQRRAPASVPAASLPAAAVPVAAVPAVAAAATPERVVPSLMLTLATPSGSAITSPSRPSSPARLAVSPRSSRRPRNAPVARPRSETPPPTSPPEGDWYGKGYIDRATGRRLPRRKGYKF